MAERDPELTLHNKIAAEITQKLKKLEPEVLDICGRPSIESVHAAYGGKHATFINTKDKVIHSPEQFVSMWLDGYMRYLSGEISGGFSRTGALAVSFKLLQQHKILQDYVFLFLQRTYHREYRSLQKVRPDDESAFYWIGQERASYGIFVTPRFKNGQWENDKSEIRHFRPQYWTIGHVLATGLVVPFEEQKIEFSDVASYLKFFRNVLVRNSGSIHELAIADLYCEHVTNASEPLSIPLLIPEIRYGGIEKKHQYRLDFCVIRQQTYEKVGFELSPWSTHGYLQHLKGLTQQEINNRAQGNFEAEMKKVKAYFYKYEIYVLLFTDSDLAEPAKCFDRIKSYLNPIGVSAQLRLSIMEDFKKFTF